MNVVSVVQPLPTKLETTAHISRRISSKTSCTHRNRLECAAILRFAAHYRWLSFIIRLWLSASEWVSACVCMLTIVVFHSLILLTKWKVAYKRFNFWSSFAYYQGLYRIECRTKEDMIYSLTTNLRFSCAPNGKWAREFLQIKSRLFYLPAWIRSTVPAPNTRE